MVFCGHLRFVLRRTRKRTFLSYRDHTGTNGPPLPRPDRPLRNELRALHRLSPGEEPMSRLPDGGCRQTALVLCPMQDQNLRGPHGRLLLRLRRVSLPAAETPGQALHNKVPDEHAGEPPRYPGAGSRGVRRAGGGPLEMPAVRISPLCSPGSLPALRLGVVRGSTARAILVCLLQSRRVMDDGFRTGRRFTECLKRSPAGMRQPVRMPNAPSLSQPSARRMPQYVPSLWRG